MNLLLEEANSGSFLSSWGLIIIMVVFVVYLVVNSIIKNKRERESRANLMQEIKVGTKVITYSGVYGKIMSISETSDGKTVVLETGSGKYKSYLEVHVNAISALDNKNLSIINQEGKDKTKEVALEPALATEVSDTKTNITETTTEKSKITENKPKTTKKKKS